MWLHVTSGRGPGECQLAVRHAVDRIIEDARAAGLHAILLEAEATPHGFASALVSLSEGAEAFVNSWEGTVQWICQSPIRKHWKRKNWFIRVDALRPPAIVSDIDPRDLKFEARRASGPGGQHVNTTESAVRVVHEASGMVAQASEERSQHRNRALALARLHQMLAARRQDAAEAAKQSRWATHDDLERGNPIRVYEGLAFKVR